MMEAGGIRRGESSKPAPRGAAAYVRLSAFELAKLPRTRHREGPEDSRTTAFGSASDRFAAGPSS